MTPIFIEGYSSHRRMFTALILSMLLILLDHKLASFDVVRGVFQSMVSPLQYIASTPRQVMDYASENLVTRQQLKMDNQRLQMNELLLRERLLELDILKQENDRLRSLLSSPVRDKIDKMVAEIQSVDSDPYSHQVVIDRGQNDGLYEGQPVVNDTGVVGQIRHVGLNNSRVLLITDISHAIPLRVHRNGLRVIARGTGSIKQMDVTHVPNSSDIRVGDTLVTSGLGGKFPEGYPVATVNYVSEDPNKEFAKIRVSPLVEMDKLRYLLLLTPQQSQAIQMVDTEQAMEPGAVNEGQEQ
ncbi:rod shape-determining protein MreC [Thalassotalea sp. HSM 43]|uniref:rod shape-determining protein MreC n=1 Tax=Thalassotalea sp. HSM 43 TaxID=2552945 RepID=UPI001081FB2C|nr:rod shape-determining protein MreC [Thalassotalea sp. HSM 43]QBY04765.1 rod shape-determining protein MreC [Thalassotalea sp. HSM 43]